MRDRDLLKRSLSLVDHQSRWLHWTHWGSEQFHLVLEVEEATINEPANSYQMLWIEDTQVSVTSRGHVQLDAE